VHQEEILNVKGVMDFIAANVDLPFHQFIDLLMLFNMSKLSANFMRTMFIEVKQNVKDAMNDFNV